MYNARRKYKPSDLEKRPLHPSRGTWMQPVLENKNPNCCWVGPTVPLRASDLGARKDDFPQSLQSHTRYRDAAISKVI